MKAPEMNHLKEFLDLLAGLADIPPHDPDRFETLDGSDNPSCTNGLRAEFTIEALAVFQKECGMDEDVDVAVGDLICDLLHLIHSKGFNPKEILEVALGNFVAEAGAFPE